MPALCGCFGGGAARNGPSGASSTGGADFDAGRFQFVRGLGAGGFGEVQLMLDTRTRSQVAVKFMRRGPDIDEYVARELLALHSLRHPNLVAFHEAYLTPTKLALVMEYVAGGDMFSLLEKRKAPLPEAEAKPYFWQLASALAFLHGQGVCHRDIKLENVLLDGSHKNIKLADFGLAKGLKGDSTPHTTVGSPPYIPPEVLHHGPPVLGKPPRYDGFLADMWSLGVLLYTLLCNEYPFKNRAAKNDPAATFANITKVQYSVPREVQLSSQALDLIRHLLVMPPEERLTAEQMLRHPWLAGCAPDGAVAGANGQAAPGGSTPRQTERQLRQIFRAAQQVDDSAAIY